MARHVLADMHLDCWRLLRAIMRKEADHLLNPVQRHRQPFPKRDELLPRQIAVLRLKFVKLLDNHGAVKFARMFSCTCFNRSSWGSKPVGESYGDPAKVASFFSFRSDGKE